MILHEKLIMFGQRTTNDCQLCAIKYDIMISISMMATHFFMILSPNFFFLGGSALWAQFDFFFSMFYFVDCIVAAFSPPSHSIKLGLFSIVFFYVASLSILCPLLFFTTLTKNSQNVKRLSLQYKKADLEFSIS